jgi:DNA-binding Lrp family transcriptional regulator
LQLKYKEWYIYFVKSVNNEKYVFMDRTDYKILSELQSEGRLSSQALAERVGLSTTPCWRRVKKLEEDGVIAGTVAILDPQRIGLEVIAVAEVSLAEHDDAAVREFEDMVERRPEILECHTMSGGHARVYTTVLVVEENPGTVQFNLHDKVS